MSATASGRRRFARRFRRNRAAVAALVFLGLLVLVAVFADLIAPHDPNAQDLGHTLAGPFSPGHLLGTDELGRDELSRLIVATRIALQACGQALIVGIVLGVPPALVAGYLGGWVDTLVVRVADAVQSFPPLFLAIGLVGVMGPGLRNAMVAVGIVFAPGYLRITRAAVLEVRQEDYVEASRSIGTPAWRIIWWRILPNVLPPILVQASLAAGFALLAEAGLSFLGLGAQPPDVSWGSMLDRGYDMLSHQAWLTVLPGLFTAVTVLAFNVLGDGLRDSIGREARSGR